MIRKILLYKKGVELAHELWRTHNLPVDMTIGQMERGLTEVAFDYNEEDEPVVEWLVSRAENAML